MNELSENEKHGGAEGPGGLSQNGVPSVHDLRARIADALPVNVAVLDAEGTILCVNAAWTRFAKTNGYSHPRSGLGESYLRVCDRAAGVDGERAREAAAGIRAVLAGSVSSFASEYRCDSPEQERWFQMVVTPLVDEKFAGVIVMHLDVTERRQVEDSLRTSERRLELALEGSNTGLWEWDIASDRVVYSRTWKSQLGFAEDEISDRLEEWETRLHPDDRDPMLDMVRRYLASPWPNYESQFRLRHRDGFYLWIMARAAIELDEDGRPKRMYGCHIDITQQRRDRDELERRAALLREAERQAREYLEAARRMNAELELRVRERTLQLETANRELEAFSDSVSHDLRAPLRQIDGFASALAEEYGERLDSQGLRYLELLQAGARKMNVLIDALLDLSRVTSGATFSEEVDLSDLAVQICAGLNGADPARKVDVRVTPGIRARGDRRLLGIALQNLLCNAWKYTSRHATARIEFGAAADGDGRLVYQVRDDGAGFDMSQSEQLFRAFHRLHGSSEFEGTGIGLATVQRIVRRHGGEIWVEAAPEQGATFYFTLGTRAA